MPLNLQQKNHDLKILTAQEIFRGLRTEWLGQNALICLDEVDSTNKRAKEMALGGAIEGTVVVAEKQTEGRGRLGREWVSVKGAGLYFSVILRPSVPTERLPLLTMTAGVATASALDGLGIRAGLKWPNDIVFSYKKAGGILTETVFEQDRRPAIVLGIGLNTYTSCHALPQALESIATSIRLQKGGDAVFRVTLLQAILSQLEKWYGVYCAGETGEILQAWRTYDVTVGEHVEVHLPESKLVGMVERICSDGALLVRDPAGKGHRVLAGDVIRCKRD